MSEPRDPPPAPLPEPPAPLPERSHFRAVVRLIREQRRVYGIGLVFVTLGAFTSLAYPQAIRLTIDEGIQGHRIDRIDQLAVFMLVLLIAEDICVCLRNYYFNLASERLAASLRQHTFEHLLNQEIAFFDSHSTGEITSRLAADIPTLQRLLGEDFADVLRVGIWAVGGTALLFYTSPILTGVVLLSVPPLVVAASLLGRRVKRFAGQMQTATSETGTIAEESISGIRTVRAFSQEGAETVRYSRTLTSAIGMAKRKIRAAAIMSSFSYMIGESAALLAIWVGGHLILGGRLTSGALISFILYAFLVARGYRNVSQFWADGMRTLGSTDWIFRLLERKPELPITGGLQLAHIEGRITFERLRFSYPSRPDVAALDDLNLSIAPGEIVAFVGRSGAGKSTILNLLLRFYDPDAGRVLIDGRDIRQLDASWLRSQIGIVLQEPVLFSRSVAENIRYGRADAEDDEVAAAAELACAREFIARFPEGYATKIGDRGVQLSGGQRQRLAIARAVIKHPQILVLDEATSALDSESESFVQQALNALPYRPTTLIVAHRLSTVVHVDRVVVIEDGRIVAVGRHDALLQTSDFYRRLVEMQLLAQ